ncbi:MAG: ACT domain-containing protein [Clostridia bacterium]|nr:ACT domain-containing protein [Clostridia bacterium]
MKVENFLIINSKVLPPVFEGVVTAKELLANGKAKNVSEAVKTVGISRSAFYKYRNYVFKQENANTKHITISAVLSDKAGVFSAMTRMLFENGANLVTVNQGVPSGGVAPVTVTVCTDNIPISLDELLEKLQQTEGIISVKSI